MKNNNKEKVIEQILKLIKVKSITTFAFLGITIYAVVTACNLPEWLVPIMAMAFKELFDKDKVTKAKEKEE